MRFPFDDDDGKLHPAHVIQRPHKGLVRGQTTACFHISVARSYYNIISRIWKSVRAGSIDEKDFK